MVADLRPAVVRIGDGAQISVGGLRVDVPDNVLAISPVKQISVAESLALNAAPVSIIAAPGAGRAIIPILTEVLKPAGTAYAGIAAGEDLALRYTDGSGVICQVIEATGFLDQVTAETRLCHGWQSAAATPKNELVPTANAALVAHMLAGEVTTGDTGFWIRVWYHILDLMA